MGFRRYSDLELEMLDTSYWILVTVYWLLDSRKMLEMFYYVDATIKLIGGNPFPIYKESSNLL